jgi:membrane-associated protease RseP (regulator of RpoE activity)
MGTISEELDREEHGDELTVPGVATEEPSRAGQSTAPPLTWRRLRLPLILLVLTCLSTFVAGATHWLPTENRFGFESIALIRPADFSWVDLSFVRWSILAHWRDGLIYMACVLAILLTHEMGHYLFSRGYGLPTTLPILVPWPFSPFGTMGAVIVMDSRSANRRQIFDIGLAGPLAGLVVAVPVLIMGLRNMDLSPNGGDLELGLPIVLRGALCWLQGAAWDATAAVPLTRVNSYFMAGWTGLFFTGLNMLPVGQLDGGHVTYGLLGTASRWLARGLMLLYFAYVGYTGNGLFMLMALLVMVMGPDHPRTADDSVPLGLGRTLLGWVSLAIPLVCFTPNPFPNLWSTF